MGKACGGFPGVTHGPRGLQRAQIPPFACEGGVGGKPIFKGQPDTPLPWPQRKGERERKTTSGFSFRTPVAAGKPPLRARPRKTNRGCKPPRSEAAQTEKPPEPKETPEWIWTLLGAIDPILREDGCVWTDPTPRQASYNWFCIGKPDPQNPAMIRLDNGTHLPVGTHLLEHGTSLRVNDGTQVAEIPLTARFRKAVLDYVDGLRAHDPDPKLCEGRIDPIPRGLDDGWASVVAHDDMGGSAAVLGMQIYRELTCNPQAQSSVEILSLLGKFGGRGPLRARPNVNDDRFAPPGKPRMAGGGSGDIAEHKQPPKTLPRERRFSLHDNEERGGHILQKHVEKTEAQLKQRIEGAPRLKIASSFRDESTAEQAISATLDKNQELIEQWLKQPVGNDLVLHHQGASSLGIAMDRGAAAARPSNLARMVLRHHSDGGFYVLTAYLY